MDLILPEQHEVALPANVGATNIGGFASDGEVVDAWLRDKAPATRAKYDRAAMRLLARLTGGLQLATVQEIGRYQDWLKTILPAPASVHTEMAIVRSLFAFAQDADWIMKSPAHVYKGKRPKPGRRKNRAAPEATIKLLIAAADNQRDKVLIEFLFTAGARAVECGRDEDEEGHQRNRLTWGQITLEGENAIVQLLGKGGKWRTIKLPPGMTSRLMALKPIEATDEDAVFTACLGHEVHPWPALHYQSIRQVLVRARLRGGVTRNVTPHTLRHSHATIAEERGKRLSEIRDSLGHASIETTMGYIAERDAVMIGDVFFNETGDLK